MENRIYVWLSVVVATCGMTYLVNLPTFVGFTVVLVAALLLLKLRSQIYTIIGLCTASCLLVAGIVAGLFKMQSLISPIATIAYMSICLLAAGILTKKLAENRHTTGQLHTIKSKITSAWDAIANAAKRTSSRRKIRSWMLAFVQSETSYQTILQLKPKTTIEELEHIVRVNKERYSFIDNPLVLTTEQLDAIYAAERTQQFRTPVIETATKYSYGTKLLEALQASKAKINHGSRKLQAAEAGKIRFGSINGIAAQSIASQVTPKTTLSEIEKLSRPNRPLKVWAKSGPTERS